MTLVFALFATALYPLVSAETTVSEETWDGTNACNVWPGWAYESSAASVPVPCDVFGQNCSDAVSACSLSLGPQTVPEDHNLLRGVSLANTDGYRFSFHVRPTGGKEFDVALSSEAQFLTVYPRGLHGSGAPVFSPPGASETLPDYPVSNEWYRFEINVGGPNTADPLNYPTQLSIYRQSGALWASSIVHRNTMQNVGHMQVHTVCFLASGCPGTSLMDEFSLRAADAFDPPGIELVDNDGDGISDFVEIILCGSADTREVINAIGTAGSCPTISDYTPPTTSISIPLVSVPVIGPDADGDRFPAYVLVQTQTFTFDPLRPGGAKFTPGATLANLTIDPNDGNDQIPAGSTVCLPEVVPSIAPQTDADGDGVPSRLVIVKNRVCATATNPPTISTMPVGALIDQQVDPDDSDPNTPNAPPARYFTTPDFVVGATWSQDADNDKIPAYLYLTKANFTFDRENPTAIPTQQNNVTSHQWDPDDSNRNVPVPLLTTVDADGDFIPEIIEPHLCNRQNDNFDDDGTCSGTNYNPPTAFNQVISEIP